MTNSCKDVGVVGCLRVFANGKIAGRVSLATLILGSVAWGIRIEDRINDANKRVNEESRIQDERITAAHAKIDLQIAECNVIVSECSRRPGH